ncbi:SIS domain-containing protein [Jannaschia sp. CCS1]|uniref:SIS domain-containing protein n=1 Tax=Jannaschia sp. (strain CCS1) TaxID=290400 RepID=UPI000053A2E2|nr:SIS domain-containing protein [Jannaschia sp. CCS1]ABD54277.1 glutamine--fructose-6-phosphate transaminase [Jannaschia sp. CCS1]
MTETTSQMRREVLEIPAAIDRLLSQGTPEIARIAAAVAKADPRFAVTVARGSSDHACTFLKYALELELGLPVASIGPSVASIYGAQLKLANSITLSVSQSGKSPDIVAMSRAATEGDSFTVAITNDAQSPLSDASSHTIDIHAGPEISVAATKTFVTSAAAGLILLAEWKDDDILRAALRGLPECLSKAATHDWPDLRAAIGSASSLFTLGRGPAWAISNEAALKFKETCQIHAESYSSAEVLHGPVSIVGGGFPVLCFASGDAAEASVTDVADQLAAKGARVFVTSDKADTAHCLPHVRTGHPLTDPLALIVSFYAMIEKVAAERGVNPDAPRHLNKVTETV